MAKLLDDATYSIIMCCGCASVPSCDLRDGGAGPLLLELLLHVSTYLAACLAHLELQFRQSAEMLCTCTGHAVIYLILDKPICLVTIIAMETAAQRHATDPTRRLEGANC